MVDYFTNEGGVLPNKLGIDDQDALAEVEARVVHTRQLQLNEHPMEGCFDFEHLCAIHHYLLSDLYDYAGSMRDVRIAKGDSVFCYPENLDRMQKSIFTKLKNDKLLKGLGKAEFIEKLSYLTGDLIALHPFREGNGRAIRIFLKQLSENAGYDLNYEDAPADDLLSSDIAAFNGNIAPLQELLHKIVSPT